MSALLYTSPRSSPSPAGEPFSQHHHHHHHHPMVKHQVSFGQSHHQSTSSSLFGNSTSSSAGSTPQPGTPTSASSFGFGFASAVNGVAASTNTGSTGYASSQFPQHQQHASSSSTSPFKLPSNAMMSPSNSLAGPSGSSNRRRRRRSDSPEDREMDESHHRNQHEEISHHDSTSGKRVRRELRPMKSMASLATNSQASSAGNNTTSGNNANELDVGKALASLSKPALLSVLTSLLASQPSLKPVVLSLLPAPSLEAFTEALQIAERRVLDALPVGRNLRDEYVWSRVRAPLEEYISEARLALSQFCPTSSPSLLSVEQEAHHQQQQQHPATTFSFLFTLTQSVRKLEVILPRAPLPFGSSRTTSIASINNPSSLNQNDPLVCFLPALINQWHVLATKLSTLVNQNGRVLSAEMVRTWFKQLDSLIDIDAGQVRFTSETSPSVQDTSSVGRKACEAVKERFIKELGWLVGIRTVVTTAPLHQPQSQQGVQAVASQLMDSRMMMADNDDSDEEL